MSFLKQTTVDSILAGLSKGITALDAFAARELSAANSERALAYDLTARATIRESEAARADRVSGKLRGLLA